MSAPRARRQRPCARAARAAGATARLLAQSGQASIELLAVAPLVVLALLAGAQVLAAGAARELADHAAEAGAVALLQDADPTAAARAALPGWSRRRMDARVRGSRVLVRLRPPVVLPGLAGMLEASAQADAGPIASRR